MLVFVGLSAEHEAAERFGITGAERGVAGSITGADAHIQRAQPVRSPRHYNTRVDTSRALLLRRP
jgi:hypothetical protein